MWNTFRKERAWQIKEFFFTLRLLRQNPSAVAGFLIIALVALMALAAALVAPYDPIRISLGERLRPPSAAHLFGTDELGRDILSRVMYGAQISLRIGVLVVVIAGGCGALLGAISGYLGRRVDNLIMRVMDGSSRSPLVLALALAAAMGPSLNNAIRRLPS
jgi:peptide/nickel transport system permease protein